MGAAALTIGLSMALSAPAAAQSAPFGDGAYPAVMVSAADMPDNTVYHPADLKALNGRKLPIVIWTEGGCRNIGNRSAAMLADWASHGYLVISAGPVSPTVDGFAAKQREPERLHGAAQLSQPHQQRAALAWAIRENERAGGKLKGLIDTSRIAAAGSSCGGVQAIDFANSEPRVTTTVVLDSGLFPDGKSPKSVAYAGTYVLRGDLPKMRRPMIYLFGGPDDIAYPNALQNIESMPDTPIFAASLRGTTHGEETGKFKGGRFGKVSIKWLDWMLKGDSAAGQSFKAADCDLCNKPEWTVQRWKLP
jgi:dienelactone hydrolase